MASNSPADRQRPLSPNMQLYRPQLTSVLSVVNRLTGIILSIAAIALVIWLVAGAAGPQAYAVVKAALASWTGQVILFASTFAFFLHLLGGIRHLVWDTVHGFGLRAIYMSGWTVVAASVVMTLVAWVASFCMGR
jgi:succinate dehydrogenase / fumarate reductase cytochrome b subunit